MTGRARGATESAMTANDTSNFDDVVRRAQQGDVRAFESLYHAHAASVHLLCRRMVGNEGQARELLQDIFVRAWERLGSFRGESALATWLHRLGVNVILEHLRSFTRDEARFGELDESSPAAARSSEGGLDARMDIDAALARLPAGARTVFVLHDIQGYSHDEIAQMTGTAAGTARAQLWRARRHLMRLLDP